MRDVLKQMPTQMVPYLQENALLDFVDFIDSGMRAEVSNSFDGKSVLMTLTDNYASLSLTASSQLDMRLLDVATPVDSARQIVCVVCTYGTDVRESTIGFYSVNWRPLNTAEWVDVPQEMCVMTLSEDEPTLTIIPECRLDAPATEEQEELTGMSTILKWGDGKFNKY